jgi:hypothetical protein
MAAERRICTQQTIPKIKMHTYRRKCEDMADACAKNSLERQCK